MRIQPKFMVATLAVALAVPALAESISGEQAKKAMTKWICTRQREHMTARIRQGVETVRDADGRDIFHVVNLSGGGFVVAAADNRVNPVIAFSESGELERTDNNPLWSVLNADVPKRLDAATTDNGKVALMSEDPPRPTGGAFVRYHTSGIPRNVRC